MICSFLRWNSVRSGLNETNESSKRTFMIEHVIEYYEVYEVHESYDRETRSVAKFSRLVDAQALKATSNCFVISKLKKDTIVVYESFEEYMKLLQLNV
jgi:hypothetical protein